MARRDLRIDEIRHEGPGEWFVYLMSGWHLDGAHCFGEDRRADIRETMKRVRPCECSECAAQAISNSVGELLAELAVSL